MALGGLQFDCGLAVEAHSDGDVFLHALCDALLGAAGLMDIGHHFPPGDPRWQNISSAELLKQCVDMLSERGWRVVNADLTLIAEQPKIADRVSEMRAAIAGILSIEQQAVGLKATTMEGLGPIGKGEGIAAQAVVLLQSATARQGSSG